MNALKFFPAVLALASSLAPAIAQASDAPLDRATLRGLKSLGVVIDNLDPELQHAGLTPARLQAHIEEHLLHAGIAIDKDSMEFLGLHISSIRDRKGPFSLCFTIGVYQPVILSRDKDIRTATKTWDLGAIIIAQPKLLSQSWQDTLDQLLDRFLGAWRSVNPPSPSPALP